MRRDKVAIVSGHSGGIGHALMTELARRDYQACGMDLVKEPKIDITASLESHFESFNKLGDIKLIVNCAGITRQGGIKDKGIMKQIRGIFRINYFGVMNVCCEAVKWMKKGAIVNVASKSASFALPERLGYCASKGAVVSASRQMALDLAPNIRVNTVSPGTIDTNMKNAMVANKKEELSKKTLVGRMGEADEVASFICDIAENEYITGQDFIIDGGYSAV